MKILVIIHSYAPNADPRAFRWTALCEEWAKVGHEVHVIAAFQLGREREELRNHVSIHRVGSRWLANLRQWVNRVKTRDLNPVGTTEKLHKYNNGRKTWTLLNWVRRGLRNFHDLTWKKLYWPDATCFWIWPAYQFGNKLLKSAKFDLFVTVSHPFSCHVAGLLLRKKISTSCWIADSGDPFCFLEESPPNNFCLYRKLNNWIERQLLKAVDVSSVTTEGTADIYRELFPNSAEKIIVIPPLLRISDMPMQPHKVDGFDEHKIVALYVGGWHKNIREPSWALGAIEKLVSASIVLKERFELHFYGDTTPVEEVLQKYPSLLDKIVLHGFVPSVDAIKAIFAADILINVGNKTSYQLPSKLVEYMASGKPILNFCHSNRDSSSLFLQVYGNYKNVFVKNALTEATLASDAYVRELVDFVEQSKDMAMVHHDVKLIIDKFSTPYLAQRYLELV